MKIKIAIDAGHNYKSFDTGSEGNGYREQDLTFPIAHKLSELLKTYSIDTVETRPTLQTCIGNSLVSSLDGRVRLSNSNQCNLFVSIHCNKGGGVGTETLIYKKGGEAEKLANLVQSSVTTSLGMVNRGVKEQNVEVIRDTTCPAILVECGFMDNVKDINVLVNKQDQIAKAICEGVLKYLNIPVKVQNQYSYDDVVNQMVIDGITTVANIEYWEKLFVGNSNIKTIIQRYQTKIK